MENEKTKKIIAIPHEPRFTRSFRKVFKRFNVKVIHKTAQKLQQLLNNLKDKLETYEKSKIV